MSGILGGGKQQAANQSAVAGLQLQTSVYGKVIPIVYGQTRIAPNLIWYGDFYSVQQKSSSSGGKGGVGGGGGGKGGGGSGSYLYYTAMQLALCEGPIFAIYSIYVDKNQQNLSSLGMTGFLGDYGQSPWTYLSSSHPSEALNYRGIVHMDASNYSLGSSPQLPNHNVEIAGRLAYTCLGTVPDADPSQVVADILTNPHYGLGFPAGKLASLSVYQAYTIANGLWISPAYTDQAQCSSMLDDIALATNSAFVWSNGQLNMVPYGDRSITANGYTYTAPSAPLYNLTDDDFCNDPGSDPVTLIRKRPADALNSMQIECLDRSNQYNPAIVEAKDQAAIDTYGLRTSSSTQMHLFADTNAARTSVQLQLQRQSIRNQYQFKLDQRYILLDPMDIVTITDTAMGLNQQWVRIVEISEDQDGYLTMTAEEYLDGSGSAALYSFQSANGYNVDYNEDPGAVNTPILFEPPAQLSESLEVYLGLSGGSIWGGADVYLSTDGASYRNIGRYHGSSRTGFLSSSVPEIPAAANGQTLDIYNTVSVDLSESSGQLLSGTQQDATNLNTLCYMDGELFSYETATLTGLSQYDLTYLVRGAYGSPITRHDSGSQFLRLDDSVFVFPYNQDQIGNTIYLKFCSFNIWGGALQNLSDVGSYSYQISGATLSTPLPAITNLRTSYVAQITQLVWDEVIDFRPVQYEIRKGNTWAGAQVQGRVAHPPYVVQGDDTYWVAAYSQPVPNLQVYGSPSSLSVQGSQITSNVIATWDESATGWGGSFGGTCYKLGSAVVTGPSNSILGVADYLHYPDVLQLNTQGNGTYEIPSAHEISITNATPCFVLITWQSRGQHVNKSILDATDYLNLPDLLDLSASLVTTVYPEIAMSQDGGVTWGAWQKYVAGQYYGNKFKARMQLQTTDPTVQAILQGFVFSVDVPDRDDHYVNLSIPAGGYTITFQPDNATGPVAFNGGPAGSPYAPNVQVTILNGAQGDNVLVGAVSLSSCTIQVQNGGVGVARNINVLVQGY